MIFIVVGCGRVGGELAFRLFKNGHQVVVIDSNQKAFNRLHPDFRGRTVEGEALSSDSLERAGVAKFRYHERSDRARDSHALPEREAGHCSKLRPRYA